MANATGTLPVANGGLASPPGDLWRYPYFSSRIHHRIFRCLDPVRPALWRWRRCSPSRRCSRLPFTKYSCPTVAATRPSQSFTNLTYMTSSSQRLIAGSAWTPGSGPMAHSSAGASRPHLDPPPVGPGIGGAHANPRWRRCQSFMGFPAAGGGSYTPGRPTDARSPLCSVDNRLRLRPPGSALTCYTKHLPWRCGREL